MSTPSFQPSYFGPPAPPALPGATPNFNTVPTSPFGPGLPTAPRLPTSPVAPPAPLTPPVAPPPPLPGAPDLARLGPQGDRTWQTDLSAYVAPPADPFDFSSLDGNKDGVLSGQELAPVNPAWIQAGDTDRNGELTLSEHTKGIAELSFAQMDVNRDGALSGSELAQLDAATRQAFDADGNGELTRCEFVAGAQVERAFTRDANRDGYLSGHEIPTEMQALAYRAADGRTILTRANLQAALVRGCQQGPGPRPTPAPIPQPQPYPYQPQPQPYQPQPQPYQPQPQPVQPQPVQPQRPLDVVHVTSANFEQEVLRSPIPVLVDFYAPWCGPCKTLSPKLEAAARNPANGFKVVKINGDVSPDLVRRFNVEGYPSMIPFVNGQEGRRMMGDSLTQAQIEAWMNGMRR